MKKLLIRLYRYLTEDDPVPPYPCVSWYEMDPEFWPDGYDPETDSFPVSKRQIRDLYRLSKPR